MNKWEQKCKDLCREVVMSVGRCEMCTKKFWLEQHHGLFKSSQRLKLNPILKYDPDLQFCLCSDCHRKKDNSPHNNGELFFMRMVRRGDKAIEKVEKIKKTNSGKLEVVKDGEIKWDLVYHSMEALYDREGS